MPRMPHAVIAVAALVAVQSAGLASASTQSNETAMTKLAAQIIADAGTARTALAAGNTATGMVDIVRGLAARDELAAKAKAAGLPLVVPVYAELDDAAVLSNAVKAKASGAKEPQTVRGNEADFTYVAIDLDKAKAHLAAAKAAVNEKNFQGARDSLGSIGDTLLETSVLTDLPLLTAREDLARAEREVGSGDRAAATADLHQASRSLRAYEKGPHVRDARKLAAEIDAEATSADASPSPSFTSDVATWWNSVKTWFAQKA